MFSLEFSGEQVPIGRSGEVIGFTGEMTVNL